MEGNTCARAFENDLSGWRMINGKMQLAPWVVLLSLCKECNISCIGIHQSDLFWQQHTFRNVSFCRMWSARATPYKLQLSVCQSALNNYVGKLFVCSKVALCETEQK